MIDEVVPGIHRYAKEIADKCFSENESRIVNFFKGQWYVTKAGEISFGASDYKYILIKAARNIVEQFNLAAEIIVIFSDYIKFEPRTLDAFDNVKERLETGRVENLCGILVSKDNNVADRIKQYLAEQEVRIIIPFSYEEILSNFSDNYLIRNKLRHYLYSRDLFAFNNPLKTDLYFFGRSQIVLDVINQHLTNQNSGLFGLRKTGKTSIIYDLQRKLRMKNSVGIFIDCQSPSISNRHWNEVLFYIIQLVYTQLIEIYNNNKSINEILKTSKEKLNESHFTKLSATDLFGEYIDKVTETLNIKLLLLFDEVENITYNKSPNEIWSKGLDSVYFWQAVRTNYQKNNMNFTFCLIGTNPSCVEMPLIGEKDNPIFNIFTPQYVPGFDEGQTREMVRKLGRIMGIKFQDTLYAKMTEDYGGHPFLIRHVCSTISQQNPERPVLIDRIKYNAAKKEFNMNRSDYFEMLIEVLKQFYPDEYEMLEYLAVGDETTFNYFADEDYSYVKHLIGYGILQENEGLYDFRIDAIKEYIIRKKNKKTLYESKETKWSHICCERNNMEIELRKIVMQVLLIAHQGRSSAKDYVISKIYGDKSQRRKYSTYSYEDLFNPKKSEIYLKNLETLIKCNWNAFNIFWDSDIEDFIHTMDILNVEGRFDAHAKIPEDADLLIFNAAITKINAAIRHYKEIFS